MWTVIEMFEELHMKKTSEWRGSLYQGGMEQFAMYDEGTMQIVSS